MKSLPFLIAFQDFLAPRLDVYEQAIYLYIFRHSRAIDLDEIVIGFKSSRTRMACGVGEKGKPMSERTAYEKLSSLAQKKVITVVATEHRGKRIRLHLPSEIPGLIPEEKEAPSVSIEEMDFFEVPENRLLILQRENSKCFYTLRPLDQNNFVLDHIVSRPHGNNSFRNLVAVSREANNRKGKMSADDFLRKLFRDGFLNETEFEGRIQQLGLIKEGRLKPVINHG